MSKNSKGGGFPDPFGVWQKLFSDAEDQFNKNLTDMMSTPEFGDTTRQSMQAMTKYQQTVSDAGRKYFNAINLPTGDDIKLLGERLGVMEEQLGRIEAMLANQSAQAPSSAAPGPKPKRTKQPPKKTRSGEAEK